MRHHPHRRSHATRRPHRHPALCVLLLLSSLHPATASAQVTYTDLAVIQGIAGTPGPTAEGIGGGIAWLDYDNDGDLDLAVSSAALPSVLYENVNGMFVANVFALLPDTPPAEGGGLLAFDMDSDGDDDLLILRNGTNVLLRNDAGTFVDVSLEHLPGFGHWSASAAAGDFDGDGDDDLVIGNYISGVSFPQHQCARSAVLINDGKGRFTDKTLEYQVLGDGCTLGVAMSDYDNDGDLDLFFINDFGHFSTPNQLYRNDGPATNGSWNFTNVSESSGFAYPVYGMGLGVNDVDDDGWLDYYSTSIGRQALLSATPDGIFIDRTAQLEAGVTFETVGYQMTWSAVFEDLDGDGWLDLFATGGHIPAASFIKNGTDNSNLLLAGGPSGFNVDPEGWSLPEPTPNSARGISLGDADGDGMVDLAVSHVHGVVSIYKASDALVTPLRVIPKPTLTGPSATGFRVETTCGDITRMREITAGGHLGSSSPAEVRITFPGECGQPGHPLDLLVTWPSGYIQTATTSMGAVFELEEPAWLKLDDNTLNLLPTDSSGAEVTSPEQITVTAENAVLAPVIAVEDGFSVSYTKTGTAPVRFNITVEGDLLPIHPTALGAAPEPVIFRTRPQNLITGQHYTLYAHLQTSSGAQLANSASGAFVIDGETFPAEIISPDTLGAKIPSTPALGPLNVQL